MVWCCSSCLVFYKFLGVISIVLVAMAKPIWLNFLQPAFENIWNRGKVETAKSPTTTLDGSKMCCTSSSESSTATKNGTSSTGDAKKDD